MSSRDGAPGSPPQPAADPDGEADRPPHRGDTGAEETARVRRPADLAWGLVGAGIGAAVAALLPFPTPVTLLIAVVFLLAGGALLARGRGERTGSAHQPGSRAATVDASSPHAGPSREPAGIAPRPVVDARDAHPVAEAAEDEVDRPADPVAATPDAEVDAPDGPAAPTPDAEVDAPADPAPATARVEAPADEDVPEVEERDPVSIDDGVAASDPVAVEGADRMADDAPVPDDLGHEADVQADIPGTAGAAPLEVVDAPLELAAPSEAADGMREPEVDVGPSPWPLRIHPARLETLSLEDLGVRPASVDAPPAYIRRDIDDALDQALQPDALAEAGGVVVVRGGPVSGRSRTMAAALQRHAGSRTVVAVTTPGAPTAEEGTWPLAALAANAARLRSEIGEDPIIWIDHADRHLGSGLTFAVLDQIVAAFPACIVALIVDRGRLALPELVPDPVERWLRVASDPHELAPALTDGELTRASALLPDAPPMRIRWLPAWVAGTDQLRDRYRDARSSAPESAALIHAAATWVRAGMAPTITGEVLADLAGGPIAREHLAWATEEFAPGLAMLRQIAADDATTRYVVDPALAAETAAAGNLETDQLRRVLVHSAPTTALRLGRIALSAGREDVARDAFEVATGAEDPDARALALLHLGIYEERAGHLERATRIYGRAAVLDHPRWGAFGAFHLGGALEALDRHPEAVVAYMRAVEADDPEVSPLALLNLGWLHDQGEEHEAAERAYDTAAASGHPDAAPLAAFNLGWLLERQRRMREAEHRYRAAVDSGHHDAAPMAAVSLGVLLQRLQRGKEARRWLEWAAATEHPEANVAAKIRLRRRVRR